MWIVIRCECEAGHEQYGVDVFVLHTVSHQSMRLNR